MSSPKPKPNSSREPTQRHTTNLNISNSSNIIKTIDLNYKKLFDLPPDVENYKNNLEKLSLAFNNLTILPKYLKGFDMLVHLNLRSNNFTEFPKVLCYIPNLEILDISRNKLRILPKEPGNLIGLRMLNISRNLLSNLPYYIGRMSKLELLKLESNPFSPSYEFIEKIKTEDKKGWINQLKKYLLEKELKSHRNTKSDDSARIKSSHPIPVPKKELMKAKTSAKDKSNYEFSPQLSKRKEVNHVDLTSDEDSNESLENKSRGRMDSYDSQETPTTRSRINSYDVNAVTPPVSTKEKIKVGSYDDHITLQKERSRINSFDEQNKIIKNKSYDSYQINSNNTPKERSRLNSFDSTYLMPNKPTNSNYNTKFIMDTIDDNEYDNSINNNINSNEDNDIFSDQNDYLDIKTIKAKKKISLKNNEIDFKLNKKSKELKRSTSLKLSKFDDDSTDDEYQLNDLIQLRKCNKILMKLKNEEQQIHDDKQKTKMQSINQVLFSTYIFLCHIHPFLFNFNDMIIKQYNKNIMLLVNVVYNPSDINALKCLLQSIKSLVDQIINNLEHIDEIIVKELTFALHFTSIRLRECYINLLKLGHKVSNKITFKQSTKSSETINTTELIESNKDNIAQVPSIDISKEIILEEDEEEDNPYQELYTRVGTCTRIAFKAIQLLCNKYSITEKDRDRDRGILLSPITLETPNYEPPNIISTLIAAEDSTQLLVSSLNLIVTSSQIPPYLYQRFLQDSNKFLKDIFTLLNCVKDDKKILEDQLKLTFKSLYQEVVLLLKALESVEV